MNSWLNGKAKEERINLKNKLVEKQACFSVAQEVIADVFLDTLWQAFRNQIFY